VHIYNYLHHNFILKNKYFQAFYVIYCDYTMQTSLDINHCRDLFSFNEKPQKYKSSLLPLCTQTKFDENEFKIIRNNVNFIDQCSPESHNRGLLKIWWQKLKRYKNGGFRPSVRPSIIPSFRHSVRLSQNRFQSITQKLFNISKPNLGYS